MVEDVNRAIQRGERKIPPIQEGDVIPLERIDTQSAKWLKRLKGVTGRDVLLYTTKSGRADLPFGFAVHGRDHVLYQQGRIMVFHAAHEMAENTPAIREAGLAVLREKVGGEAFQNYLRFKGAENASPGEKAELKKEFICDAFAAMLYRSVANMDVFSQIGITKQADVDAFEEAFRAVLAQPAQAELDLESELAANRAAGEAVLYSETDAEGNADVGFLVIEAAKENLHNGDVPIHHKQTQAIMTADFQNIVDSVLAGADLKRDAALLGYTPPVFQEIGIPALPLTIGRGHIYSIVKTADEAKKENRFRKGVHYHGLGEASVKELYQNLCNPYMIIASKDVQTEKFPVRSQRSIVALVDIGSGAEMRLIPIELTVERTVNGMQMDVNMIGSAYEKNAEGLIKEAIAQEKTGQKGIFYMKNEAVAKVASSVQFAAQPTRAAASGVIIRNISDKINLRIAKQTQTLQFLKWFGDWMNDPLRASKAVDEDGIPLVLYHGSGKTGLSILRAANDMGTGGLYLSTNRLTAEAFGNGGEVYELYANVKNPFIVDARGKWFDSIDTPSVMHGKNRTVDTQEIAAYARKNGYDGVIIKNVQEHGGIGDDVIVFNSSQVKSANRNVGAFDGMNPNINYSSTQPMTEAEYWQDRERQLEEEDRLNGIDRRAMGADAIRARALELAAMGMDSDPDGDERVDNILRSINRADARNDVITQALEEYEKETSLTDYWEQHKEHWDGINTQVLQQLRGMYLRNNIPCGGALGQGDLFELTANASGFKQRRAISLSFSSGARVFEELTGVKGATPKERALNYLLGERYKDTYYQYGNRAAAERALWIRENGKKIAQAFYGHGPAGTRDEGNGCLPWMAQRSRPDIPGRPRFC